MGALQRGIQKLSLRQRLLAAPLLGLAVCAGITAAFLIGAERQNALLSRVAEQDLATFNRYSNAFTNLTNAHTSLYNLLTRAETLDEGTLYDESKAHLARVHQAVEDLEEALGIPDHAEGAEADALHDILRDEVLGGAIAYKKGVAAAVAMTTVDLTRAAAQLARANELFTAMNRSFVAFLDLERQELGEEINAAVRRSQASGTTIAVVGGASAALLFLVSLWLARVLSRAMEVQIASLTELGASAEPDDTSAERDEISRMAHAIGKFRQTLSELRRARDELEQRVMERTRELNEANLDLMNEVVMRTEAERHLRIYSEVIRSTGEAVVITDPDGHIVEVNPAYQRATGRERKGVIGTRLHGPDDGPESSEFYERLWRDLRADGYWTGELLDRRKSGEPFPSWALINAVRDSEGGLTHYVSVSRDITAIKQSEQKLEKLAFYDSLTSLPNRALFRDRLTVAVANAERQGDKLAVMFLDLDRFKYVNDTLGHAAGDRLLIEMSRRIGACLRATDTLARLGGDEFTILVTHLESEARVMGIAERIVETVGKAVRLGRETVYVGVSVGISFFPKDGHDATSIQRNADLAMYEAKQAGRGQVRLFSDEMLAKSNERLSLSVEIDAALTNDEFTLHYHPIINLALGRPEGVKALVRWQKADGVMISPEKFIPHAEEAGLIRKIDAWVLDRACRDAAHWLESEGRALPVRVNLSPMTLRQPDLPRLIETTIAANKLPAELLNLEIRESALSVDPEAAYVMLDRIASLGVTFSVNDYGTGYSSLSYLSTFPISCLKLDRLFIDRIGRDRASEEVIRTLMRVAQELQIRVIAEGVENAEQQAFLLAAGCELMQGFHFVRPMPSHEVSAWLAANQEHSGGPMA